MIDSHSRNHVETEQTQAISLVAKQQIQQKLQDRTGETDSEGEEGDESS